MLPNITYHLHIHTYMYSVHTCTFNVQYNVVCSGTSRMMNLLLLYVLILGKNLFSIIMYVLCSAVYVCVYMYMYT